MQTLLLYASVVLIWGTTWAAIPYQLGDVPVPVSIGYRFIIAALALYLFALVTRRQLIIPRHALPAVALQGLLLFCVNYIFVYHGTALITSGLVAVVFSLIVLFNALFARVFFGTLVDARLAIAGIIGVFSCGLASIIADAARKTSIRKAEEESRREIAAYIAEGSLSPEQGERLIRAKPAKQASA